jgi:hypothetical protein
MAIVPLAVASRGPKPGRFIEPLQSIVVCPAVPEFRPRVFVDGLSQEYFVGCSHRLSACGDVHDRADRG